VKVARSVREMILGPECDMDARQKARALAMLDHGWDQVVSLANRTPVEDVVGVIESPDGKTFSIFPLTRAEAAADFPSHSDSMKLNMLLGPLLLVGVRVDAETVISVLLGLLDLRKAGQA
jgi:hypothetical protein